MDLDDLIDPLDDLPPGEFGPARHAPARAGTGTAQAPARAGTGKRAAGLFPSHRTNALFDASTQVTETGEPGRLEFPFEEGDLAGEFEVVVSRVGDGYVLAGQDITERKAP